MTTRHTLYTRRDFSCDFVDVFKWPNVTTIIIFQMDTNTHSWTSPGFEDSHPLPQKCGRVSSGKVSSYHTLWIVVKVSDSLCEANRTSSGVLWPGCGRKNHLHSLSLSSNGRDGENVSQFHTRWWEVSSLVGSSWMAKCDHSFDIILCVWYVYVYTNTQSVTINNTRYPIVVCVQNEPSSRVGHQIWIKSRRERKGWHQVDRWLSVQGPQMVDTNGIRREGNGG